MHGVLKEIAERISAAPANMRLANWLFNDRKDDVISGIPVALFGTGSLGQELLLTLQLYGFSPICFCNSDPRKAGDVYCGLPVRCIDELKEYKRDIIIVVATHRHAAEVKKHLLDNGFSQDQVLWPMDFDMATGLFFSHANQIAITDLTNKHSSQENLFGLLHKNEKKVEAVFEMLADRKSKDLFVSKLAFAISYDNLALFKDFMLSFSEPISMFGLTSFPDPGPENFFYFNNDVYTLSNNEIYCDVGAYEGDSILAFLQTCKSRGLAYKHIYAFEPDPSNFSSLVKNTVNVKNLSLNQLGIWSRSGELLFESSKKAVTACYSGIADTGDIKVNVVSVDEFFSDRKISLMKMDPPGNVIPEALIGASKTINKNKPKLAMGAYHSFESIFEIPLLLNSLCPGYKLYLRHNSYACPETDLFAYF